MSEDTSRVSKRKLQFTETHVQTKYQDAASSAATIKDHGQFWAWPEIGPIRLLPYRSLAPIEIRKFVYVYNKY